MSRISSRIFPFNRLSSVFNPLSNVFNPFSNVFTCCRIFFYILSNVLTHCGMCFNPLLNVFQPIVGCFMYPYTNNTRWTPFLVHLNNMFLTVEHFVHTHCKWKNVFKDVEVSKDISCHAYLSRDDNNTKHDDVIKWKCFPGYWPLCGEFTGHRWIPRTKASDAELWCFL